METSVRRAKRTVTLCVVLIILSTAVVVVLTLTFKSLLLPFSIGKQVKELEEKLTGCDEVRVSDVWIRTFPKLLTESSIRLVRINEDEDLDVVLGFGTGADGYEVPDVVCDVYFDGVRPCLGGILALDGRTGQQLWRHYAQHEIFALNCRYDLNFDGSEDCLGGGRAGVLEAVSGRDGSLLWRVGPDKAVNTIMNFYTPQMVRDVDGDGVVDVVVSHGGDPLADPGSAFRLSGRLLLLSGRTGRVIRWVGIPDEKETYFSIGIHVHPDGSELILFGTGGETHPGSLWVVNFQDLLNGNLHKARWVLRDETKGIMTPPAMVDVNEDGIDDIVLVTFNSQVIAFDGLDFRQLWNYTFPSPCESYSTPSVGFFNDDKIPDFLVKFQVGPGFPIYYHSETTVLDGKTGQPLLSPLVRDTVGAQASGLTISMEGYGNDLFLYWTADCKGHEGESNPFEFVKNTNVHEQSRADFCFLRFGSQMVSHIYALGQRIKAPGVKIYDSEERQSLEFASPVDTEAMGKKFLQHHPKYRERRHVGPHDSDGIQRLISTGSLAPLLIDSEDDAHSVDHVFATYWFFPAKTKAILPEDRDCIQNKMALELQRFESSNRYHGMDHEAYEDSVTRECIESRRHQDTNNNKTYESQKSYDPFGIHMGQMTVYRQRISCVCSNATARCAKMLPFHKQMWASYMGSKGDSHANV